MEKKLDDNYKRILRAILKKSWRHHATKQQQYGHLPFFMKTLLVRWTRDAGNCWRSREEPISGPLHMDEQKHGDQLEPSYNCSMPIQDVTLGTCKKRCTIEKGDWRGSVQMVQHADDDICIYFCFCLLMCYFCINYYWVSLL